MYSIICGGVFFNHNPAGLTCCNICNNKHLRVKEAIGILLLSPLYSQCPISGSPYGEGAAMLVFINPLGGRGQRMSASGLAVISLWPGSAYMRAPPAPTLHRCHLFPALLKSLLSLGLSCSSGSFSQFAPIAPSQRLTGSDYNVSGR